MTIERRVAPVRTLEVTFNASGAAQAGARRRVVALVDVVDSSTSAEAAYEAGAIAVLGAAPARIEVPVQVRPRAVGLRAAETARRHDTEVIVVAEPRVGDDRARLDRVRPVVEAIEAEGVPFELVPNQGAELGQITKLWGRVVVIVSTTGGPAFDAALVAGAPAVGFATTARVGGRAGWDVAAAGARRAIALAEEHETDLSICAATANSADDVLAATEVARAVIAEGFLAL